MFLFLMLFSGQRLSELQVGCSSCAPLPEKISSEPFDGVITDSKLFSFLLCLMLSPFKVRRRGGGRTLRLTGILSIISL